MAAEIEVLYELKTPVGAAAAALRRLKAVGRRATVDTYYIDPLRPDLQPVGGRLKRCFRLRVQDGRATLAYKVDKFRRDKWLYSDEHETPVGDAEAMRRIAGHLGLRELVTVRMVKTLYHTPDYEIALEQVDGLGAFIEIESRRAVPASAAAKEKVRIRRFVASLGIEVGAEMNAGKPELMLKKKTNHESRIR
ncbi:MAG: CYTH domain-containing protein [Patescibacteria group bacterium]|nr:CYTH domain-containing protein [Patescibacteria group bacterium]